MRGYWKSWRRHRSSNARTNRHVDARGLSPQLGLVPLALLVGTAGCVTEVESGFGSASITASDTSGPTASTTGPSDASSGSGSGSDSSSSSESSSSPSTTDDATATETETDATTTEQPTDATSATTIADPCDPDPCDPPALCMDGDCVAMAEPGPGDLVFVELHPDPDAVADDAGEWLELEVLAATPLELAGCELADLDTDSHTIDVASLVVQPGDRVVFARDEAAAQNGGLDNVVYAYGGSIALANGDDEILLRCGGVVIDELTYGNSWPFSTGVAAQLDPSASADDNDDPAQWCPAQSAYGSGDFGTPGEANDPC